MTRRLQIHLEKRDVVCIAELLDDLAPRTCDAVWQALPQSGDVFHAKYARNELYTLVPGFVPDDLGLENSTITPIPGDVMLFAFSGTQLGSASHGYGHGHFEPGGSVVDLAVFYERNNLLLNPDVGFVPGTVFASITEGLDAFAGACQDIWRNGFVGERLTFRRHDA